MSNFRIKKTPKTQHNIKDSNTLEIKHRQKIKQLDNKKKSSDKLNLSLSCKNIYNKSYYLNNEMD